MILVLTQNIKIEYETEQKAFIHNIDKEYKSSFYFCLW